LVKVYLYEEGTVVYTGKGHSADIVGVKITPNQQKLVSISTDGAIFIWKNPNEVEE
jgi:cilia- and flagella-associated protein 52